MAKCNLLPQSAQNTKPENKPCRSAFVGRRLFACNSCTRSKTASSTIASWVLQRIACCSFGGGNMLFQLVGFGIAFEIVRMSAVVHTLQNAGNAVFVPMVRIFGKRFPFFFRIVGSCRQHLVRFQDFCYPHRPVSCDAEIKNPLYHSGGFLVHNLLFLVSEVMLIPIGRLP